ncbi:hypothetical protein OF83DRAFT_1262575 [Amylostereum chailletii]|nr:hypothetical protein OF83DRAFT_1262575 [Amylostereum chailletii]
MSAHVARLSRLFTPEYARRINCQVVYPAQSAVVKPNELESALARPLHVAVYEPHQPAAYLAATLSYGIIKGHPFMDGNKRTGTVVFYWTLGGTYVWIAFFLANEYLRAMGLPGLAGEGKVGGVYEDMVNLANRHIRIAAGELDVEGLAHETRSGNGRHCSKI